MSDSMIQKGTINFEDLGLMDFREAWDYQASLFNERVSRKLLNREVGEGQQSWLDNRLIFVEHPHVFTLGKSGNQNNLLINRDFLENIQATYYHIDRGGDITYHGPGQIVGYPIFDLEHFGLHIKQYVHHLEEAIILTVRNFGITCDRLQGATGVWIDPGTPRARKICAIGVKASRHITMHGFAFNVNTDLSYFNHINPCGFLDKGVTSLAQELGSSQDMGKVKTILKDNLISLFRG
ncbi:MAG: lipoyl(octanoyl) transferase LipB [Bacteroidales bacterium]|nr:lipoyl(octanoyl) transferase LipB [Bacteroidales bacterium]MDD4811970.1 lipoyl(octanoyl) transferase LipB [Bacteroidales bacterium]